MWMDPFTDTYVILLSNSVHPHLKAAITPLRSRVASVAAAGLDLPEIRRPSCPKHRYCQIQPTVAAEASAWRMCSTALMSYCRKSFRSCGANVSV